jgi:hypothetical protein
MKRLLIVSGMLLGLLVPLGAHHSFDAEYDANKIQNLTGTVTKIDWVNPHAYIYFTAKDAKGDPQTFRVELGPPYALTRGGWKRDTVKIGDTITVEKAAMAKDGSNSAGATYETSLIVANGQRMVMR